MEQPIVNESTEETSVSDRLEGVEDDLQLLKSEVKQTLIDLREFMMKGSAMSVTSALDGPMASSHNGQAIAPERQESPLRQVSASQLEGGLDIVPKHQNGSPSQDPPRQPEAGQIAAPEELSSAPRPEPAPVPYAQISEIPQPNPVPVVQNTGGYQHSGDSMDSVRMGLIIEWLGSVAERGLTPKQLKPFLQAYERSGHLTPTLAMFTYGSLEELASDKSRFSLTCSPVEVSQCLRELHEIIINPGYTPEPGQPLDQGQDG